MRTLLISFTAAVVLGQLLARTGAAGEFAAPPPPARSPFGEILRTAFNTYASGQSPESQAAEAPAPAPIPVPPAKQPPAKTEAVEEPARVAIRPGQGIIVEEIVEQPAPAPIKRTYRITPATEAVTTATPVPVPPAASSAAAPATVTGQVKPANALQRFVGRVGQKLSTAGYDRILVPPGTATVQVSYVVQNPPAVQAVTAPAPAPGVQPVVTPSPQAPQSARKRCLLFHR